MAFNLSTRAGNLGTSVVEDTAADATRDTPKGSSTTAFAVYIDNTANSGTDAYLKLWNNATPTVGTTVPDMVLFCPRSGTRQYNFGDGVVFGTAFTYACTTSGADSSSASPSAGVQVVMIIT